MEIEIPADFTIEALLAEIMRSGENAQGLTAQEIADLTGQPLHRVRKKLMQLKREGKIKVGRRWRERLDGAVVPVPVYSLVNTQG